MEDFVTGVEIFNPGLSFFLVSCKTKGCMMDWINWIRNENEAFMKSDKSKIGLRYY